MKDLKGRLLHPSAVRIQNECISVESGKSLKTFIPQPQQGYRFMLLFIDVVLSYFCLGFRLCLIGITLRIACISFLLNGVYLEFQRVESLGFVLPTSHRSAS